MSKLKLYDVRCWFPPGTENAKFGVQKTFDVVAEDCLSALSFIAKEHPAARIDSVNDRGVVHYII